MAKNRYTEAVALYETLTNATRNAHWKSWGLLRLLELYGSRGLVQQSQATTAQLTSLFMSSEYPQWWSALAAFVPLVSSLSDRLNLPSIKDHLATLYNYAIKKNSNLLAAASEAEISKRATAMEGLQKLIKPRSTQRRRNSKLVDNVRRLSDSS